MSWFSETASEGNGIFSNGDRVPGDFESLAVTDTVAMLAAAKISPLAGTFANIKARAASMTLENADVRFRVDGGDPSATEGHLLRASNSLTIKGTQALRQFKAIRTGTSDGTLRITYFF